MPSFRAPGMDHDLYPFSALPSRPPLSWPGGARVAFAVVLHLEHWELDPPAAAVRDPRFKDPMGDFRPDFRAYTLREYGNRVGIFRIFDALDRHGIRPTVAVNAAACERYPYLIEECRRRGWEFAAHGSHATRMVTAKLTERQERDLIDRSIATVGRATGSRPRGWIAQDYGETARTPQLLAEAGLEYVADWPNDDQPYRMTTTPSLISIPSQAEWDDVQLLWHRRVFTQRYPALIEEALSVLHAEGASSGRYFGLGIHPWLFGMPHRIRYLNEALDRIVGFDGLWQATLGEVAGHMQTQPADG
ncbi:polysaccharide deacetylase family protein [Thalassobaculum sp.]|uniref:polysaccharide deacetylase family protein n=1 Tax=Thalassobaculum sp. TaxID=2022740 RepID=UPI0032EEF92F